jgi:hypothetical protein
MCGLLSADDYATTTPERSQNSLYISTAYRVRDQCPDQISAQIPGRPPPVARPIRERRGGAVPSQSTCSASAAVAGRQTPKVDNHVAEIDANSENNLWLAQAIILR